MLALESKFVETHQYMTLAQATKMYQAKEFPSPTKIFAALNKKQTEFFKKSMEDKTSAVYKAVSSGRKVHNAIETGKAKDELTESVLNYFNANLVPEIDEVWGQEYGLVSQTHKFRGKFDGVGVLRGKETVWDYKKVNKLKTPSQIKNYIKQLAAYAIAHDEMYGTKIEQVALMMIGGKTKEELTHKVFVFDGDSLSDAKAQFIEDTIAFSLNK